METIVWKVDKSVENLSTYPQIREAAKWLEKIVWKLEKGVENPTTYP